MWLPRNSLRELYQAIDDAQPLWVKIYIWAVGVPAWCYLAYRFMTTDTFELNWLDKVAFGAFATAAIMQMFYFAISSTKRQYH
jgi:hypothetical protein